MKHNLLFFNISIQDGAFSIFSSSCCNLIYFNSKNPTNDIFCSIFIRYLLAHSSLFNICYCDDMSPLLNFISVLDKVTSGLRLSYKGGMPVYMSFYVGNRFFKLISMVNFFSLSTLNLYTAFDVIFYKKLKATRSCRNRFLSSFYFSSLSFVNAFSIADAFFSQLFEQSIIGFYSIVGFVSTYFKANYGIVSNPARNWDGLDLSTFDFLRKCFAGPFKQVSTTHAQNVISLDFVSFYPSIALNLSFASGPGVFCFEPLDLISLIDTTPCFFLVQVRSFTYSPYPLYDVEARPIEHGVFKAVLYGKELFHLKKYYSQHYSFKILKTLYFPRSEAIFKKYINDIFGLRQFYFKSTPAKANIMKVMLNIVLGVFSTKHSNKRHKLFTEIDEAAFFRHSNYSIYDIIAINDGLNLISYSAGPASISRFDWWLIIISSARVYLDQLRISYDIIACDVDNILISELFFDAISRNIGVNTGTLGSLRVVDEFLYVFFFDKGSFIGVRRIGLERSIVNGFYIGHDMLLNFIKAFSPKHYLISQLNDLPSGWDCFIKINL